MSGTGLRRRAVLAAPLAGAAATLARPAIAQGAARTLRFVPHANLGSLDPLWSTALISFDAALMVFDTLYGLDEQLVPRPQMAAGHELSDDRLTWRFTLREGLSFHDGERVRAADAVASLARWAQKDLFGLRLRANLEEMRPLDDRRFEIRLKKPFAHLLYGMAATACFVMPERTASGTDAFTAIRDFTGSGPYTFLRDEWISGASAAFARNARYVPRDEPPSLWAGGKAVHLDRVEWKIMPDAATAASALQKGEVDWWERPLVDLVPQLRRSPGITVQAVDPFGFWSELYFNNRAGPFENPKLRRALLPAVSQLDFMQAYVGEQTDLMRTGVGVFLPGSPMETRAGMEVLARPDLERARRLVRESGYAGEPVIQLIPTDLPAPNAIGQVAAQMLKEAGLNVQVQTIDWGSVISRVNNRDATAAGQWHCYAIAWAGLWTTNPGSHQHLYGVAPNPRMDALKEAWFDAADLASQKAIAERMQLLAFEEPPFLPVGQYFVPQAWRNGISGIMRSPVTAFWNVRKA